jgi:hypothetical protein
VNSGAPKFADIKGVIKSRKSKNTQYKRKKTKRTNNELQTKHRKLKIEQRKRNKNRE